MVIQWNKVTWYSKLLAVVLFILTFALAFYFGVEFQKAWDTKNGIEQDVKEFSSGKVTLVVGQTKTLENIKVTLNSVPSDSRCPINVVCVWAGQVKASFTLVKGTEKITKDIGSESPEKFGEYTVSMMDISPSPVSNIPISQKDYKIVFNIEKK